MMNDQPLVELKKHWGYDSFRPLQREAIDCVLGGRDSVVVLPTGGGKSLCYQVPALCGNQVAVVVSPLISLMKDQVDSLIASGINAASLNSSMSAADQNEVTQQVRAGELRLLYLSPERLVLPSTVAFLKSVGVRFLAIDEAHCIIYWGHDFRPEYSQLSKLREDFPDASVHAFTATATARVRDDIARQLNLADAEMLVGNFDRPNLIYRVHRRNDPLSQMRAVIDRYPKQSGVIYCISRKEVENTAATLNSLGYSAKPYHAGLSDGVRSEHQEAFINEQVDIIVATVAFGMGIDKSNVRFVIHAAMPKSLEAYQQESGRAGRDGLPAECAMLFSGSDLMTWKRMNGGSELLDAMYSYCTRSLCRHQMLVEYFGQTLKHEGAGGCNACDVCQGELNAVDNPLIVAQKILSCVHRVNQRYGAHHVANVLLGSSAKKILEQGHDKLSTYGLLSEHSKNAIVDWVEQLVGQGFLMKAGEYGTLAITESGRELLRGDATPELYHTAPAAKKSSSRAADDWEGVDRELFESLRALRRELATEKGIPPFVVFHDASLRDMARTRPSALEKFATVQGVGEKKLADYGQIFVERVAEHCVANDVAMDQGSVAGGSGMSIPLSDARPKVKMLNQAKVTAFESFARGCSVEDVANKIERAKSTTHGYLSEYIRAKEVTDSSPWVDPDNIIRIQAAASEVGSLEKLSPIKEKLGDEFSYDEIRVVVDCLRVETGFE